MADADLSQFLHQINADVIPSPSPSTDGKSNANPNASANANSPALPISAKLTLLQAQIDQLSKNISNTLTQNKHEFKRLAHQVAGKESQLIQIESSIQRFQDEHEHEHLDDHQSHQVQHFSHPIPELLKAHQALISTNSITVNLLKALRFYHSLTFSIESLEKTLSENELNPTEIFQAFQDVDKNFSVAGKKSDFIPFPDEIDSQEQIQIQNQDLGYLSNRSLTLNLFQRFTSCHLRFNEMLEFAWNRVLGFKSVEDEQAPRRERQLSLEFTIRKKVKISNPAGSQSCLTLKDLVQLLKRKQLFKKKLSSFSEELLDEVTRPLLETSKNDRLKGDRKWRIKIDESSEEQSRTFHLERVRSDSSFPTGSIHSPRIGTINQGEEEDEEEDPWSNEADSSFTRSAMSLGSHSSRSSTDSRDSDPSDEVLDHDVIEKGNEDTIRQPSHPTDDASWKIFDELEALVQLLSFLDEEFQEISDSETEKEKGLTSSETMSIFPLLFLPPFLKLLFSHLQSHLPATLLPLQSSLSQVEVLKSSILNLHSGLTRLNLLKVGPKGLEELGDEINLDRLKDWIKEGSIEKKMIEKISEERREKARELVLVVGLKKSREQGPDQDEIDQREEQGWDPIVVEMESEMGVNKRILEKEKQSLMNDEASAFSDAQSHRHHLHNQTRSQTELEESNVDNILGFNENAQSNQIKRSSSSSSNGSSTPLNSNLTPDDSRETSLNKGRKLKGKAALGNVKRVVSARDQLGSGPFPNEEQDGWGLNDPGLNPTTSNFPSRRDQVGLEPQEEDIDEDAWGLTEEEIEDRRIKRASMINSAQNFDLNSFSSNLQTPDRSKSQISSTIQPSISDQPMEPSSTLKSFELNQEDDDDIDEDAWGLTEEEQKIRAEKRASRNFASSNFQFSPIQDGNPSSSGQSDAPALDSKGGNSREHDIKEESGDEVDDEDDAWGLSESQLTERNERRASKLLSASGQSPATQTSTDTSIPNVPSTATPKANEISEEFEPLDEPQVQNQGQTTESTPSQPLSESLSQSSMTKAPEAQPTPFSPQLEEDEEQDDAWGLSEEQIQERAERRASRLIDHQADLAAQSREAEVITHQPSVLEQDEKEPQSQPQEDSELVASEAVTGVEPTQAPKPEDLANVEDGDEEEGAWGLTVDEQQARAERRASKMLGIEEGSHLISASPSDIPSQVESHQVSATPDGVEFEPLEESSMTRQAEDLSASTESKRNLEEEPEIKPQNEGIQPQAQAIPSLDSQMSPPSDPEVPTSSATGAEQDTDRDISSLVTPTPPPAVTGSLDVLEQDEDEDAWGLTSEEKQERLDRRASALLTSSLSGPEEVLPVPEAESGIQPEEAQGYATQETTLPSQLDSSSVSQPSETLEEDAWDLKEPDQRLAEKSLEALSPAVDATPSVESKSSKGQTEEDSGSLAQQASETSFEQEHPFREPVSAASSDNAGIEPGKASGDSATASPVQKDRETRNMIEGARLDEPLSAKDESEPVVQNSEVQENPSPSLEPESASTFEDLERPAKETQEQETQNDKRNSADDVHSNDASPVSAPTAPAVVAGLAPSAVLSGEDEAQSGSTDTEGEAWSWQDDESSEEEEASKISPRGFAASLPRRSSSSFSASQNVGQAQNTGAVQAARRGLSPMARTASPRSTASPQLRQAALRSASAAVTRGTGNGINTPVPNSGSRSASALPQRAASNPGPQPQEIARPSTPPIPKEKCSISKRSIRLIKLLEEVIRDATELLKYSSSTGDGQEILAREASAMLDSLIDILDLHRALMPVAHCEVLINVPSLAMQFANDCAFISRELSRLEQENEAFDFPASTPSGKRGKKSFGHQGGKLKLSEEARLTTALGKRWFDAQISTQEKVLMELLDEADSFARTYESERFKSCERVIKQVLFTLTQLSSAWAPPLLAPTAYLAALGRLVEKVLTRLLSDIESLEDISETESEKLAQLCREFGPLEELFQDPATGQTAVALFVPSWFKASYLSEILTGSLVDIDFLLTEAGALQDYTPKELASLVRALFSDTPNRSKLLDKIERGSA